MTRPVRRYVPTGSTRVWPPEARLWHRAKIDASPLETPLAIPVELISSTLVLEDVHVVCAATSSTVPSDLRAVAVIWTDSPGARRGGTTIRKSTIDATGGFAGGGGGVGVVGDLFS